MWTFKASVTLTLNLCTENRWLFQPHHHLPPCVSSSSGALIDNFLCWLCETHLQAICLRVSRMQLPAIPHHQGHTVASMSITRLRDVEMGKAFDTQILKVDATLYSGTIHTLTIYVAVMYRWVSGCRGPTKSHEAVLLCLALFLPVCAASDRKTAMNHGLSQLERKPPLWMGTSFT